MQGLETFAPGEFDPGQIRAAVVAARGAVAMAMGAIGVAIKKCVEVGGKLLKGKERMGHGHFESWLEAEGIVGPNEDQISKATAVRWMRLARFDKKSPGELEKCSSVTQAYRLAELLPEPDESTSNGGGGGGGGSALSLIGKSEQTLQAELKARPLEQWSREDLRLLKARLQALVEVYEAAEQLLDGTHPPQ